jgi:serine/threonine protein kinase
MNISGYRIEGKIGTGGMAIVYRAIQESLGRPVALKVMNPLYSDSREFSERFLDEGRLLASIDHKNIITIHDIGVSGGFHFIAMEYVTGGDLGQKIKQGITAPQATKNLEIIAECLSAAHDSHIVHRDIKPANILFRKDGTLLLTDFGIAKQLTTDKGLTATGSIVGSAHYLSPEQAQGKPVDGRADIYSLGIVYYEMLVGERPFAGSSDVDVAIKHVTEPLPELPADLADLQTLLDRMTRKDREERFANCGTLLEAIRELQTTGYWSGEMRAPSPAPVNQPILLQDTEPATKILKDVDAPTVDLAPVGGDTLPIAKTEQAKDYETTSRRGSRFPLAATAVVMLGLILLIGSLRITQRAAMDTENVAPETADSEQIEVPQAAVSTADEERRKQQEQIQREMIQRQQFRQQQLRLRQIQQLLRDAGQAIDARRLTTPRETSAYTYYKRVLALDPDNAAAQSGIDEIAEAYYRLAKRAEKAWAYEKAMRYVDAGLAVRPDHARLQQLRRVLQADEGTTGRALKETFKDVKGWFD